MAWSEQFLIAKTLTTTLIAARLNEAMGLIEEHNSKPAGVLPRSDNLFTPQLLAGLLKRISKIPPIWSSTPWGESTNPSWGSSHAGRDRGEAMSSSLQRCWF